MGTTGTCPGHALWPAPAPGTAGVRVAMAPRVTIAIPVFNEEAVIPELLKRLAAVLDGLEGEGHEVLLVDDGSTDGGARLIEAAAVHDPRLRLARLSRNFGHQACLSAALELSRGDVVVCMDADLQDRPESIPQFIRAHQEG